MKQVSPQELDEWINHRCRMQFWHNTIPIGFVMIGMLVYFMG